MFHFIFMIFYSVCLYLVNRLFNNRDRELIILRQQTLILKRQLGRKTITVAPERMALLIFGRGLASIKEAILIIKPETFLAWHRKLVRRRWTYLTKTSGRPRKSKNIRDLIIKLARENPIWGYARFREK